MKAWEIIGYNYDRSIHCVDCARSANMTSENAVDQEGNDVHPIFAIDEDPGTCDDCGCDL